MMAEQSQESIRAEAAAWLARLHSEERTADEEAGFQRWLDEDQRHRAAFETLTSLWEAAGSLPAPAPALSRPRRREVMAAAASVVVAGGAAAWLAWPKLGATRYETSIGEQKAIVLADHSRMVLDTGSRVEIAFTSRQRSIRLMAGRAHFDVAKDPGRPFMVDAGDKQVVAIGTAFDVQRDRSQTSITLVEGRVAVISSSAPNGADMKMMQPGEQLVFEASTLVSQTRPDIASATAWQTGRAVFDDIPLNQAVAQLNRYEQHPLLIGDPAVGEMHVSGSYRTGDGAAFARSMAELLPIAVQYDGDNIVLTRNSARSDAPAS